MEGNRMKNVSEIKQEMVEKIKSLPLPIDFIVDEADADYGYKLNKDLSIESIGEYSEDVTTLEELTIVDLANLIYWNDPDCKGFKEIRGDNNGLLQERMEES